jgi:transcriptional regulator with XRE-family HTH domain
MASSGDHDSPERVFARRQRQERDRRGWRYRDLAAAVAERGIDLNYSAFAKTETSGRAIRLDEAMAVADALGMTLSQMLSEASTEDLERELADVQRNLDAAGAESAEAIRRAAYYWNRGQEIMRIISGLKEPE